MQIDGRFWLTKDEKSFLGNGRIELLENIEKTGSINGAAKAMKMSYKAAWERINSMNEIADEPIIIRLTGGKGGGGTVLTPHAHELIKTYKRFRVLHRQFIERFAEAGDDPEKLARILGRTFLTTSARNQLLCQVISIKEQGVSGEITLQLGGGETLISHITLKSIRSMGLVEGCSAYAIIKSSDLYLCDSPNQDDKEINILHGTIIEIQSSDENAEVTIAIDGGGEKFTCVVNLAQSQSLILHSDTYLCISKKSIILGL